MPCWLERKLVTAPACWPPSASGCATRGPRRLNRPPRSGASFPASRAFPASLELSRKANDPGDGYSVARAVPRAIRVAGYRGGDVTDVVWHSELIGATRALVVRCGVGESSSKPVYSSSMPLLSALSPLKRESTRSYGPAPVTRTIVESTPTGRRQVVRRRGPSVEAAVENAGRLQRDGRLGRRYVHRVGRRPHVPVLVGPVRGGLGRLDDELAAAAGGEHQGLIARGVVVGRPGLAVGVVKEGVDDVSAGHCVEPVCPRRGLPRWWPRSR